MNRRFCTLSLGIILSIGSIPALGSEELPETRRQIAVKFNKAYSSGNHIEAIRWGLQLEERQPGQPLHQYNLACVYALAGNDRTALAWLRRSVDNRFRWTSTIENDSDLESLRGDPLWPKILAAVRANAENHESFVRHGFSSALPSITVSSDHDPTRPAPLIIALHGYGGRPDGYPALWRPEAEKIGAVLATPQGLQPLGGAFFWGGLEEAEAIVKLTIEHVRQSHAIDESRIVLTGFSQGGYMAMAIGTRNPDLFAGVIPMAGAYYPEVDAPPPAPQGSPRYFFMVGSLDESKAQCRQATKDFRAAGYPVDLRIYPGVGHTFPRFSNRELGKALRFVLEGR